MVRLENIEHWSAPMRTSEISRITGDLKYGCNKSLSLVGHISIEV